MKLTTPSHTLLRLRPLLAFWAVLASLAAASALHAAAPTFDPFTTVKCPVRANHIVMGDFNGDGIPDVAVLSDQGAFNTGMFTGHADVFFGDGHGGVSATPETIQLTSSSSSFTGLAAGRVLGHTLASPNDKPLSDLVFTLGGSVQVWEWNGTAFQNATTIGLASTSISATKVAVGDVTGAGHQDIVVSDDFGSVGIVLIPNNGAGTFGALVAKTAGGCDLYAEPVLMTRPGHAGFADVVLSHFGTVGVLVNQNGVFDTEVAYTCSSQPGLQAHGVAAADIDGDGKPDLVVLGSDTNSPPTWYLGVHIGNGDGTFGNGTHTDGKILTFKDRAGVNIIDRPVLAAADLNGDGVAEVVTLTDAPGTLSTDPITAVTVTRFTGQGAANVVIEGQDDYAVDFIPYDSILLGYDKAGTFTTFNNDAKPDVIAGTAAQISDSGSFRSQFLVYHNTTSGGHVLPPGRELDFGDVTFSGNEGTTITIPVLRGPQSTGRVLAPFTTNGSTALEFFEGSKSPFDYTITTPANHTYAAVFNDNDSESDIVIDFAKSSTSEPVETIVLTLTTALGAADVGPNNTVTISIIDGKPSILKRPAAPAVAPANIVKGDLKSLGVAAIGRTGSDWKFTVTEPVAAGAKDQHVTLQTATDPDNGPWTDLIPLTLSGAKWTGTTRTPPIASKLYFRAHVTATGFAAVDSPASKPYCVIAGPELALNLTAQSDSSSNADSVHEFEVITYHFEVANVGLGNATNVVLNVPIPEHTTFVNNTTRAGQVQTTKNKAGETVSLQWTFTSLPHGATVFEDLLVQVDGPDDFSKKDPNAGFGYLVTAGKTKKSPGFGFTALDQGVKAGYQIVPTFPTEILGPIDLKVTSDASGNVYPGNVITYTLTAGNSSPNTQTSVVIQDHLPAGTVLENVYAYVDPANANYNASSQPLANPGPFSNPQVIYTRNPLSGTVDLSQITNPVVLVLARNLLADKPGKEYDFVDLRGQVQAKAGSSALPVFDSAVAALIAAQVVIPTAIHWNIPGIAAHTALTEKFQVRVLYDLDKLPKTTGATLITNNNYDFTVAGSKKPLSALYGLAPAPLSSTVLPIPPVFQPGDLSPVIGLSKTAVGDQQLNDPHSSGNGKVRIAGFGDVTTAVQGRGFDYEILYTNTGSKPARNVVIHDVIPGGDSEAVLTGFFTQSESGGQPHQMSANQFTYYDKAGNIIPSVDGTNITKVRSMDIRLSAVNALTPLAPYAFGIIRYSIQAKARPAAPGQPPTVIHAFGGYQPKLRRSDPEQGAYISSSDLGITVPATPPDLPVIVVKDIDFDRHYNLPSARQWLPGDKVELDFDFTQNGDIAAGNTQVKLVIPTGTTLLTASPNAPAYTDGTQGSITVSTSGQNATLGFGDIEAHGRRHFKIFVQINSPLDPLLVSRGRAYFDIDPELSWVPIVPGLAARHRVDGVVDHLAFTEKQAIRVAQPTAPRLGLSRSAPYTVSEHGSFAYTITFSNSGDTAATNVNLGMQIPFGTEFVRTEAGFGTSPSGPFSGDGYKFTKLRSASQTKATGGGPDVITWHFPTLPAHGMAKIILYVQIHPGFFDECVRDHSLYVSADNAASAVLSPHPIGTWVIGKPFDTSSWEVLGCFLEHLNIPINKQTQPALTDYVNKLTGVSQVHAVAGLDGIYLNNSASVYAIGGGQALVIATGVIGQDNAGLIGSDAAGLIGHDGASLITEDGAGIISHDGGTLVAMGAASAITIKGIANFADSTCAQLLADPAAIVAAGAGNIIRGGLGNLLTDQGAGLKAVSNIDGSFFNPATSLAASLNGAIDAGGGSTLAGAGNLAGAGALAAHPETPNDAGITVLESGGSIVAAGAGNVISNDGGSVLANDGATIVAAGAGN